MTEASSQKLEKFLEKINSSNHKHINLSFDELAEVIPSGQNSGLQMNEPDMNQIRKICVFYNLKLEITQDPKSNLPIYQFSKSEKK
jgi:hypothetical protein